VFYKILALAIFSLVVFFIIATVNSGSEDWYLFFYMLIFYAFGLGVYSLNIFDFFGEEWKRK